MSLLESLQEKEGGSRARERFKGAKLLTWKTEEEP